MTRAEVAEYLGDLRKMFPALAADNVADCSPTYAIERSKRILADVPLGISSPNRENVFACKDRNRLAFALKCSVFHRAISHVISSGTKEQMVRANTAGVVAMMTNIKAIWDRAVVQFPGHPMGGGIAAGVFADPEIPVPLRLLGASPFPASFRANNLRPESHRKGILGGLHLDLLSRSGCGRGRECVSTRRPISLAQLYQELTK